MVSRAHCRPETIHENLIHENQLRKFPVTMEAKDSLVILAEAAKHMHAHDYVDGQRRETMRQSTARKRSPNVISEQRHL